MTCKLCGASDLPLFYTQGNRRQFKFYRCPDCRLVVYDTRTGVNQEKYILTRVDPALRHAKTAGISKPTRSSSATCPGRGGCSILAAVTGRCCGSHGRTGGK